MKREITDWVAESKQFDQEADIYDQYRPSYPIELIEQIISTSGIHRKSRIIEVGAGSGKATELFVNKGFRLTCIEPGVKLAHIGSRRFSESGLVDYVISRFEELENIAPIFDLAISAQAFHWVPKPIGYQKLAECLNKEGYIALFWNMYIRYDDRFATDLANVCKDYSVLWLENRTEMDLRIQRITEEIRVSGLFGETRIYEYLWEVLDTYEDFINFLRTGNGYISMNDELRTTFNHTIKDIFDKAGGKITRKFNCVLFLAQKLS